MFFYLPKLTVFSKIGNDPMRSLRRKKRNARPKSNARAHLKQRKKHSHISGLVQRLYR